MNPSTLAIIGIILVIGIVVGYVIFHTIWQEKQMVFTFRRARWMLTSRQPVGTPGKLHLYLRFDEDVSRLAEMRSPRILELMVPKDHRYFDDFALLPEGGPLTLRITRWPACSRSSERAQQLARYLRPVTQHQ